MYSSKKLPIRLFPKVPGLQLENLATDTKSVSFSVASTRPSASCPVCGQRTARLHSHYRRTVADLPRGERPALAAGQELPLPPAGVPTTDLRRAPGFRGRALTPQDDWPERGTAAGWLRAGRRGRCSAAMAPRHEGEPL